MSQVSTLDAVVNATVGNSVQTSTLPVVPVPIVEEHDAEATDDITESSPEDEKQLKAHLRKAESAFTKGNKELLVPRVECGRWCHEVYVLRQSQGHKDRSFTSQLIFNRLAFHADSKDQCNGTLLAGMYKTVETLADGDNWKKFLTFGKLKDMTTLIQGVDGTETYGCFDPSKLDSAKALFAWACGDGINKPSREDISARVLELKDPVKFAQKQAEQARKKAEQPEGAAESAEEEAPEAPANLISTDVQTRPTPSWKDVPDGMAALFQEGCMQQPGHSSDMMRDFAKQFVWIAHGLPVRAFRFGQLADVSPLSCPRFRHPANLAAVRKLLDERGLVPADEFDNRLHKAPARAVVGGPCGKSRCPLFGLTDAEGG
jgi:hypothetical protein